MATLERYALFKDLLALQVSQLFQCDWKGERETLQQIIDFDWTVSE